MYLMGDHLENAHEVQAYRLSLLIGWILGVYVPSRDARLSHQARRPVLLRACISGTRMEKER